tara:strand:- start:241 stop:441 length:201 start_codon:yes stop_codon:yes gene_type:complete
MTTTGYKAFNCTGSTMCPAWVFSDRRGMPEFEASQKEEEIDLPAGKNLAQTEPNKLDIKNKGVGYC